jgi:hypothetical protein
MRHTARHRTAPHRTAPHRAAPPLPVRPPPQPVCTDHTSNVEGIRCHWWWAAHAHVALSFTAPHRAAPPLPARPPRGRTACAHTTQPARTKHTQRGCRSLPRVVSCPCTRCLGLHRTVPHRTGLRHRCPCGHRAAAPRAHTRCRPRARITPNVGAVRTNHTQRGCLPPRRVCEAMPSCTPRRRAGLHRTGLHRAIVHRSAPCFTAPHGAAPHRLRLAPSGLATPPHAHPARRAAAPRRAMARGSSPSRCLAFATSCYTPPRACAVAIRCPHASNRSETNTAGAAAPRLGWPPGAEGCVPT